MSRHELDFLPNSSLMPTFLVVLLEALRSIIRSRAQLQLENLAFRHQICVLQRSTKKRPRLRSGDRLFWTCLSRVWRDWRSALVIVKRETVVAWHRSGFRLFWTWKVRHGQSGRPAATHEIRGLIRRMCRENPTLGRTSHSRRTAQARHRHRRVERQ
jgi:putative transposase